ncbi:MAG: hypothetical protein Q9160_003265 [Pyrenula sp. 1 TL-2023]
MPNTPSSTQHGHNDSSDYGSDPDEEFLSALFSVVPNVTLEVKKQRLTDIEDHEDPKGVKLPKLLGTKARELILSQENAPSLAEIRSGQGIRDYGGSAAVEGSEEERRSQELAQIRSAEIGGDASLDDPRSPLERFRMPPRKALSVTDLISPSWCELQYFYSLVKHGRKRRTPAMRQGSKVHKELEEEIHVTVAIDVRTKEDAWGLRLWNIIQGLQTLRETGVTRELEIWGVLDGELVNGVVDELTYFCPDPTAALRVKSTNGARNEKPPLPDGQKTMTDYLLSGDGARGKTFPDLQQQSSDSPPKPAHPTYTNSIYLIDTKTRGFKTLPTGSSLRPTHIQLHLYHHMLTQLALGNLPLSTIVSRNSLDPDRPFSDSFIAQIAGLNEQVSSSQDDNNTSNVGAPLSSQDSIDILTTHNNLSALWALVLSSFRTTLLPNPPPPPPSSPQNTPTTSPTLLSPLLTARYISSTSGTLIGNKTFTYDQSLLDAYLADSMAWWKGARQAQGVQVEEAWKCRGCDFREGCAWVKERDEGRRVEVLGRGKGKAEGGKRVEAGAGL